MRVTDRKKAVNFYRELSKNETEIILTVFGSTVFATDPVIVTI